MRYILLALLMLSMTLGSARTIVRPALVGKPSVLAGSEALAVFKQCSRSAPVPDALLIGPSPKEIEELEHHLLRHIATEHEAGRPSPADTTFSRQYVAYRSGTDRKIYGNYFPSSFAAPRDRAIVVCDGGAKFWGATFDPNTHKVESVSLNGSS